MAGLMRTCLGCGQTDDHPRHVVSLPDGTEVNWHMDCHRIATRCEICTEQTSGAEELIGEELRAHLTKES